MTFFLRVALLTPILMVDIAAADTTTPQTTGVVTTTKDAATAKAWGLTESDWQRYEEIMSGPRGIWSPGLDPLTSLGVSAETESERRRYAELLVEIEKQRTEKELAFDREYQAAWARLYPDLLPIMSPGDQPKTSSTAAYDASRLLVFVSTSSKCKTCNETVTKLINKGASFDLFVLGTAKDDLAIRRWAQEAAVPPEHVRSRRITLNHDNGQWMDLGGLTGTLPAVFKRSGDQWLSVQP
ncbi:TIGR03759 family integrating conjugative element protein [Stutzerimonas stutzeri]